MNKNVKALGWVSFLTDVSSEMILSLLPLFLTALGAGKTMIGLIEGIAESTASILKVFSGWISDKLGKRKILIVCGYSLSTITKPLIALAASWWQVLGVRFVDRIGKGIRTSPRDALIADSVASDQRGVSFGFHRAMDTAGAVVGTLLASALIFTFTKFFNMDIMLQYRTIFWISLIPGIMAVIAAVCWVKEIVPQGERKKISFGDLSPELKKFLVVAGVFELANFSYAFFILRAADLGVALALIPIIYLVYNLSYVFLSQPVGRLSDIFGRKAVLMGGFIIFALLSIGFAFAFSVWQAWVLFVAYGLSAAIINSVPRALVADLAVSEIRGTAYGAYYAVTGMVELPASAIAGFMWDFSGGPALTFSYAAIIALLSAVLLYVLVPGKKQVQL